MSHLLYVNCFDYRTIKVACVEQASPTVEMRVFLEMVTESNLQCCKEYYTILSVRNIGEIFSSKHEFQRENSS